MNCAASIQALNIIPLSNVNIIRQDAFMRVGKIDAVNIPKGTKSATFIMMDRYISRFVFASVKKRKGVKYRPVEFSDRDKRVIFNINIIDTHNIIKTNMRQNNDLWIRLIELKCPYPIKTKNP